jgi:hypothetical protein
MSANRYADSLLERFKQQARQAKQRGLGWEFTFEAWQQMWLDSGKLHLRGKGTGKFVMARRGDVGPYSESNCFICSFEQNIRDGHLVAKERPPKPQREARGWTLRPGVKARGKPYQVMVGSRYIGVFSTQSEAEIAYTAARVSHQDSLR